MRIRAERKRFAGETVTHTETGRHTEHEIGTVALFVEHAIATGFRQNPLAERAAAVGDQRLHLRDRPRVAVTVAAGISARRHSDVRESSAFTGG